MKLAILFLTLFSINTYAVKELEQAPPIRSPYVAIDITATSATLDVSSDWMNVEFSSTTQFNTAKNGQPILFLRTSISEAYLDGEPVTLKETSFIHEDNSASYIDLDVKPGDHELVLKGSFFRSPVASNQLIRIDYIKGDYIEKALPANFLYDFYELSLAINVENESDYKMHTNGTEVISASDFSVHFPAGFNSSFFFLDIIPKNTQEYRFEVESDDGRTIPVIVYATNRRLASLFSRVESEVRSAFSFLEAQLGVYPYETIHYKVIDNNRGGAYAGALILDEFYLNDKWVVHELGHSWYLKGISPVNGYDGWFHEGFAEWARAGFPRANEAFSTIYRGSLEYRPDSFRQSFPRESWGKGSEVLSRLDKHLESQGGLVPLMKKLHAQRKGSAVSTKEFFEFLEGQTGEPLQDFFEFYFR